MGKQRCLEIELHLGSCTVINSKGLEAQEVESGSQILRLAHIGLLKTCTSYVIIGNTFCLRSEGWNASCLALDSEVVIMTVERRAIPLWTSQAMVRATALRGAGPSSQCDGLSSYTPFVFLSFRAMKGSEDACPCFSCCLCSD